MANDSIVIVSVATGCKCGLRVVKIIERFQVFLFV